MKAKQLPGLFSFQLSKGDTISQQFHFHISIYLLIFIIYLKHLPYCFNRIIFNIDEEVFL